MREYSKVYASFWTSPSVRELGEDARQLALYLLTCQHGTMMGAFRLPTGYAADDLQWPFDRVDQAFVELAAKGFATRCSRTQWVWIHRFLEWNPAENPNQRKSLQRNAAQVPESCTWRADFVAAIELATRPPSDPPGSDSGLPNDALPTLPEPLPNQEQEQEQEQEYITPTSPGRAVQPTGMGPPASPEASAAAPVADPPPQGSGQRRPGAPLPPCPEGDIAALWCTALPTLSRPRPGMWSGAQRKQLADLWRRVLTSKHDDGRPWAADKAAALDWFDRLFRYVAVCDHLMGRTGGPWQASLLWLIKPGNLAKVMDGAYDTRAEAAA